ncbi:hypothetical protein BIW11_03373 [Tropilaelaps mercedesae]|uniref:Uncharacterized protein n=1 Tax=Tropilaelaps mercedesae TaxID=418985 RepID=A0A1V9XMQ0_9ACAR|nr:hypothetical protein BIW11_03373 [Tropilaelaps mercedesae]
MRSSLASSFNRVTKHSLDEYGAPLVLYQHLYSRDSNYRQSNSSGDQNPTGFANGEMVVPMEEFGASFSQEAWEIGGGVIGGPGDIGGQSSSVGQGELLDREHMPGGKYHRNEDFGCLEPSTVRRRGRTPTKYRLYDRRGSFSFAGHRGIGLFYFQVKVNYVRTTGNVTYYCCAEAKRDSRCKAGLRAAESDIGGHLAGVKSALQKTSAAFFTDDLVIEEIMVLEPSVLEILEGRAAVFKSDDHCRKANGWYVCRFCNYCTCRFDFARKHFEKYHAAEELPD